MRATPQHTYFCFQMELATGLGGLIFTRINNKFKEAGSRADWVVEQLQNLKKQACPRLPGQYCRQTLCDLTKVRDRYCREVRMELDIHVKVFRRDKAVLVWGCKNCNNNGARQLWIIRLRIANHVVKAVPGSHGGGRHLTARFPNYI